VHGVLALGGAIELADGAVGGLGRVGGADGVAVLLDGVLGLEDEDDHRAAGHEGDQLAEEGALAVDRVKALGLLGGEVDVLHRQDVEAGGEQVVDDLAGVALLDGVGLDDRKGAFFCHGGLLLQQG